MDRGGSQQLGDRFLPKDICGVPPDAIPVFNLESSDEDGTSSEPEVCLFLPSDTSLIGSAYKLDRDCFL